MIETVQNARVEGTRSTPGQRVSVLPEHRDRVDLLQQEAEPGHGHRGDGQRDGRADIPLDGAAAAADGGLRVDDARDRVRAAGDADEAGMCFMFVTAKDGPRWIDAPGALPTV